MRVLVCGGRNFGYTPESNYTKKDFDLFNRSMDYIMSYKPTTIIEGRSKGADEIGALVASALGIEHLVFPADWEQYGRSAGPIRNRQMLVEGKPDLVVAFPGGKGTADMVKQAKSHGIKVVEIT